MDEIKIRKKNLIMFPLGTVGRDMMYNLVTSYLLTFVLFTHKLTAAQLSAITAIMVGARIFDALNDPIMGNIIERTRTKWGKFKPWLVIGILSTSIVIYLAFNVHLQGWSFVWFFGVIYFLYSITYTMHDISYWGMVPALSSDANTRNQYTSRATLFAGIGGMLAAAFIPMLTAGESTIGGNAVTAYGRVALIIAILGPAFLAFTVFGVTEQRNYNNEPILRNSGQSLHNTCSGRAVKISRRLISYDYWCILCKSSGNGDSLLLATRQPRHFCAAVFFETYQIYELISPLFDFRFLSPRQKHHSFDVLVDRVAVYQVEILEYVSDICFAIGLIVFSAVCGSIFAAYKHLTLFIGVESADNIEQSGLSASAFACYRYKLTNVEVEIDARKTHADGIFRSIVFRYPFELYRVRQIMSSRLRQSRVIHWEL